jgi:hypothetical protein
MLVSFSGHLIAPHADMVQGGMSDYKQLGDEALNGSMFDGRRSR